MAKYKCPHCDYYAHTSGAIPNPNEYSLVSSTWICNSEDKVNVDTMYLESGSMFKCIGCNAVVIFWSGDFDSPSWYKPEAHEVL